MHVVKEVTIIPDFSRELYWWRRLQKGNILAFKALINGYSQLLFSFGSKHVPDAELVKNCVQELFLDIWDGRESLTATAGIKTYLFGLLRRKIQRSLIARQGALQSLADPAHFSVEFTLEAGLTEDEPARTVVDTLRQLIEQLSQRQQEVVYLKYFQELNCDQIAEVASLSSPAVSELLQTAIRQVKSQWKVVFSAQPTPPNIEKLLWNESFRKWVLKPTSESDAFWHCWRISNPERVADLKLARTVVSALQVRDRQMPTSEQQVLVTQTLAQIKVPVQRTYSFFFRWQPANWSVFTELLVSLAKRSRKNKASLS
ncbi:RNA polymerase sigma factor [Larkinella insperata]|uniref:RNA polymerase sigma factor n=1 Tax=Larkinella insperata TaxID=332158 RepID=A0ABW3Q1Q3_9BACT|nr:sigma-70 family RNA polymerase sigma factor [Larkinella insperata]